MKQFVGISPNNQLKEAVKGLQNPKLIILCVADKEKFEAAVIELEALFPNVPSIACVAQSYGFQKVLEHGIMVTGFCGELEVRSNILTNVSTMPVKRIKELENDINSISGNGSNTVCIDFCSGNDEAVLTTISSVLSKRNIPITGGTAWEGLVACNGVVYEDACAYALVKNLTGKVKVYKENLYTPTEKRFLVTKSIPSKYIICELDGKPAQKVYLEELGLSESAFDKRTFINPLGHCVGDEIYIVSIKESVGNQTFSCFRKVHPKTTLSILQIGDIPEIVAQTIQEIRQDFSHISGVFSINCLFRYLLFQQKGFVNTYFQDMESLGTHSGMVGLGEHYNNHHTNQTMSCVVFE